jgi:hypothetical protein
MPKTMLILRACGSNDEPRECESIKTQAELYGIQVSDYCPKNSSELSKCLYSGNRYDYIYLSAHGDENGFENSDGSVSFSWVEFGVHLCSSACMKDDCVVLLSCCRGGLNQIAYDLFACCGHVSYVIGPRQSLSSPEMHISFSILLYNIEQRRMDPIVACEKIKSGTDIRFVCFDRLETEADIGYVNRLKSLDSEELESINDSKRRVGEPPIPG